ncbi:MAG: calcium/sodium antiporter [Candidatus Dojkabacteria bacterium]
MELLSLFSLLIVLIWVLVHAADLIEDAFVFLARRMEVGEFFIGFVILSAVSSLPELSIALNSNNTIPELSVGNLLGASLILLTLIIGMTVIKFHGVTFTGRFREREVVMGLLIISMSILALFDRQITIVEGIGMVFGYLIYAIHIYLIYRNSGEKIKEEATVPAIKTLIMLGRSAVGVLLILVASALVVDTVIEIGSKVQISESLIGLFILALGTNIPELTILYRAKDIGQIKLAVGNFFGSAAINTFILGLLAILSGGVNLVRNETFLTLIPVLVLLALAVIYFLLFSFTGRKITKVEGYMLIGVYLSLLISEGLVLIFFG